MPLPFSINAYDQPIVLGDCQRFCCDTYCWKKGLRLKMVAVHFYVMYQKASFDKCDLEYTVDLRSNLLKPIAESDHVTVWSFFEILQLNQSLD